MVEKKTIEATKTIYQISIEEIMRVANEQKNSVCPLCKKNVGSLNHGKFGTHSFACSNCVKIFNMKNPKPCASCLFGKGVNRMVNGDFLCSHCYRIYENTH